MVKRAACGTLHTTVLWVNGTVSKPVRNNANSGVLVPCWVTDEIRVRTLFQKGCNEEQDQNTCSMEPTDPQALQQYGEADGYSLAILSGV